MSSNNCERDDDSLRRHKNWAIAWLCAASVTTIVIGMRYYTTLGTGYLIALIVAVVGIFLTTISLYIQSERKLKVIALVSIFVGVSGWVDGAHRSQNASDCEPTSASTVQAL